MSLFAASKSASAAHPEGTPRVLALPVAPASAEEGAALGGLLARARAAGLGGARIQGYAARPGANRAEVVHAGLGLVATALAWVWPEGALLALGGVALCAGVRCLGGQGAGGFFPRAPCLNLVLRGRTRGTRRLVVASLDRAAPVAALRWAILGGAALAGIAVWIGPDAAQVTGGLFAVLGAWAWLADRCPRARAGAPEVDAVEAVLAEARRLHNAGDTETAVIVSGCGAAAGDGPAAFCDWWDIPAVEIVLVGGSASAVDALTRAGLAARALAPERIGELR